MSIPPEELDRPSDEVFCPACGYHHVPGSCDLDPREAERRRDDRMLQRVSAVLREERDRDPIAWEFRALCKTIERSQEKMEASWVRAMSAIEHAANAWEAKGNDQ